MGIDFCFAIRYFNKQHFEACYSFIKEFDRPIYLLPNTTADGYLIKLLDLKHDYVVSIDEDAFLYNYDTFFSLLEYFVKSDYTLAGMRDGAVCSPRAGHPMVINPFFMLLNRKKVAGYFDKELVKVIRVADVSYLVTDELLASLPLQNFWNFNDDIEPYYPFFLTLLKKGAKFYYLNCRTWQDDPGVVWEGEKVKVATIVSDQNNADFLIHCWFTSYYEYDGKKSRFDVIRSYAESITKKKPLPITSKLKLAVSNNIQIVN